VSTLAGALVAELAGLSDAELLPLAERLAPLVGASATSRPAPEASPYMTVAEAAAFLRCAPKRVYNLRSEGRLTRAEEGGRALLLRAEVLELVATEQSGVARGR
jgi:hypothetical protein